MLWRHLNYYLVYCVPANQGTSLHTISLRSQLRNLTGLYSWKSFPPTERSKNTDSQSPVWRVKLFSVFWQYVVGLICFWLRIFVKIVGPKNVFQMSLGPKKNKTKMDLHHYTRRISKPSTLESQHLCHLKMQDSASFITL